VWLGSLKDQAYMSEGGYPSSGSALEKEKNKREKEYERNKRTRQQ